MTPPSAEWHRALQEAADWYVCLNEASAQGPERQAWAQWLRSGPLHGPAWAQVNAVGQRFAGLRAHDEPLAMAAGLRQAARAPRRRSLRIVAGLCLAGASGWLAWRQPAVQTSWFAWHAALRTGVGEIRDTRLPDGSRLWMNTATAADFAIGDTSRRLTLHQGEILVQTAPDSQRPFIVATRHGTLRALGTRFLVRWQDADVHLAVFDGAVEVRLTDTDERRTVERGAQVTFSREGFASSAPLDAGQSAWHTGRLNVDNARLADVLEQLSRYRHGYLAAHPSVAGLRVTGSYPVPDTNAALALLADALPVRIHRRLPWWVSVEPR